MSNIITSEGSSEGGQACKDMETNSVSSGSQQSTDSDRRKSKSGSRRSVRVSLLQLHNENKAGTASDGLFLIFLYHHHNISWQ